MTNQTIPPPDGMVARVGLSALAAAWAGRPGGKQGLWSAILLVAVVVLLLAADLLLLSVHPGNYTIDIGTYRASFFLAGTYDLEVAPDGVGYRWTSAASEIRLEQARLTPDALLSLSLGGRPEPAPVQLTFNGRPWIAFTAEATPRVYSFALPPSASQDVRIGIQSPTFTTDSDPRRLGVKLLGVQLALADEPRYPAPALFLAQVAVLALVQLLALRLGWPRRVRIMLLGALALGLAALLSAALPLAYAYLLRLAVAVALLLALTSIGLPIAQRRLAWAGDAREIRLLWSLTVLACCLRLVGVLYPTFGGQDLDLNLSRLVKTMSGQMIIIAQSSEFADGRTIYPPGPYLATAPGYLLIGDRPALLQGAMALLDGTTALLVALLARRLGGGVQAARLALILYAGSATTLTVLSYSFSAQVFGQWFATPIALLLMSAERPVPAQRWAGAAVLLLLAICSHIGVAILLTAWFGMIILVMLARPDRNLVWAVIALAAAGLFAFTTLYVDIVGIMLSHFSSLQRASGGELLRGATPLLLVGLWLVYTPVGLGLLPLGLAFAARSLRKARRLEVPLAWILTALVFLVVDLILGLQVRYFYFLLPLALAAVGVVLGRLATRGRWARLAAWATALLVAAQTAALWFSVTMGDGKLSLTPLTH
ncbi:MAG TPA: hypothetical protein VFU22_10065 [Roseiflexaceae bacterium]|nr:hypothetical protein [Roseiflexaceae bacterium]